MSNLKKWNRNQLIDTNQYIRLFLSAVDEHLSGNEKRTLFMISRFYTFGAAAVGERNMHLADHFFKRGQQYFDQIPEECVLMKKLLINIHDRSRSFFFHRKGEFDKATELIENVLGINRELEELGLPFLLFDRVQQYQNYAKVLFSRGDINEGLTMLAGATSFLISKKSELLPSLEANYLTDYGKEHKIIRTQLMLDILLETSENLLLKNESNVDQIAFFFDPVLQHFDEYVVYSNLDEYLRRWLMVIKVYLTDTEAPFLREADNFKFNIPSFAKGRPHEVIKKLVEKVNLKIKETSK